MMDFLAEIINNWDPIDLFPMAPKDEYEVEISRIHQLLADQPGITNNELAKNINQIFIQSFGEDVYTPDPQKCAEIADKILSNLTSCHRFVAQSP